MGVAGDKTHVTLRQYKMLNGNTVGYKRVVTLIKALMVNDTELTPTEITDKLGFVAKEFMFVIPYLANQNILQFRRDDDDKLLYFKHRPNLLSEMFYPMPRFHDRQILGSFIHRTK
jgi:hypothetical protein